MLEVTDLHVSYGPVRAVHGVSLTATAGQVTLVLGANGAGKTTSLRAIAGFHKPDAGSVWFDGRDITGMAAHRVVRRGMVLVPEGRKIFLPLTVEENLRMGGYAAPKGSVEKGIEEIYQTFPILAERRHAQAGLLSGGEQQMLAFGRALMSRPKLMLMDEPSMGLAPAMVERVLSSVRAMADTGIGILMVEQNAEAGLRIADTVAVVSRGETVWTGTADEARDSKAIVHAMLGEAALDGV
ncbi:MULTISPECIES: ABC transporter ATP-binding protein [Thermocrispum]|jgi:branched-chain amino acid transport system ATP-binding protein|uniref:ABC transporter ATP-binding protein n=1 Tax=Thermocrispum agreste TaxID=37925 RepID=A0A2W4KZU2_9PSEU|nr:MULTISPECIES: ABC transporter ATP-binding protein [Thermocrispum]PZM90343.1 MAG: ABC transporter ATP-binding protein [Thermocrispum agreste]